MDERKIFVGNEIKSTFQKDFAGTIEAVLVFNKNNSNDTKGSLLTLVLADNGVEVNRVNLMGQSLQGLVIDGNPVKVGEEFDPESIVGMTIQGSKKGIQLETPNGID